MVDFNDIKRDVNLGDIVKLIYEWGPNYEDSKRNTCEVVGYVDDMNSKKIMLCNQNPHGQGLPFYKVTRRSFSLENVRKYEKL